MTRTGIANLLRYLRLWGPYRAYTMRLMASWAILLSLYVLDPFFLMLFINEGILKTSLNMLVIIVASRVVIALVRDVFYGLSDYHRVQHSQIISADVRQLLLDKLLRSSPKYLETRDTGELIEIIHHETELLDHAHKSVVKLAVTVVPIFMILGIMFAVDARLAVCALVPLPFFALFYLFERKLRARNGEWLHAMERLLVFLKEKIFNLSTIQSFTREKHELGESARLNDQIIEKRMRVESLSILGTRFFSFLRYLTTSLILLVGGRYLIADQSVTLGVVVLMVQYGDFLVAELRDLFEYLLKGEAALASLDRMYEILDHREPIADHAQRRLSESAAAPSIAFHDVSFRYQSDSKQGLNGVSFEIPAGKTVALVGSSGAGKSTIFKLLNRFYDPREGSIEIGGADIRGLGLESLRRDVILVSQQAVVFHATARENILYGNPDATHEEVVEAARLANIHDFIHGLPRGYDTMLGEGGANLSGGQKQRVCLARAFLKRGRTLLLDEPTSALDPEGEQSILASLDRLRAGRTTLIIAHRLSTIRMADEVMVLDRGQVVGRGTHQELYGSNTFYRNFVDIEFARAA